MKVHVLFKKEEIAANKLTPNHVAIVFDVLLATSTITACLAFGAKEIYPVLNEHEAYKLKRDIASKKPIVAGEMVGETITNFKDPLPLSLREHVKDRSLILSTTNGTVAIRKASSAKAVFIASLLNAGAVAEKVRHNYESDTIIVVCSGSQNSFCLEDFYGAGFFIYELLDKWEPDSLELTDSALSAKLFYETYKTQTVSILNQAKVGKKMLQLGLEADLQFVSKSNQLSIVPKLTGRKIII